MKKYLIVLVCLAFGFTKGSACTRVVYKGKDNLILTARSMDWKEDLKSDLWVFPRGMYREGKVGENSLTWTSKYGSVIASAYDIASTDGMNEKGLVANLLWLAESTYADRDSSKKGITISAWVQYILDNYASVQEAVEDLKNEPFQVVSDWMPTGDRMATLHLSISDANGDNAIFEYINGKLVIHHDPSYQVMTNSPIFEKQLALMEYWNEIGGTVMLPGTNRAADRFVRASFYTHSIPQTANADLGVASVLSVIRNCSVPFGISTPNQPNISSTRWRTVANQRDKIYYFESVLSPNVIWLSLNDLNLKKGAPVLKLKLSNSTIYTGDVKTNLEKATPFEFLGLE